VFATATDFIVAKPVVGALVSSKVLTNTNSRSG